MIKTPIIQQCRYFYQGIEICVNFLLIFVGVCHKDAIS
jgi:hypothetical protein